MHTRVGWEEADWKPCDVLELPGAYEDCLELCPRWEEMEFHLLCKLQGEYSILKNPASAGKTYHNQVAWFLGQHVWKKKDVRDVLAVKMNSP